MTHPNLKPDDMLIFQAIRNGALMAVAAWGLLAVVVIILRRWLM